MSTFSLAVTRLIKAPRNRVFDAFLDAQAEIMAHFAPSERDGKPMTCVLHALEPHVGGRLSYSMVPVCADPDEPGAHRIEGRYLEIARHERIVQTQEAPGGPTTRVTYTFEDAVGGTQVTIRHDGLPGAGWVEGAKHGWASALANLAAAWAAQQPTFTALSPRAKKERPGGRELHDARHRDPRPAEALRRYPRPRQY